MGSKAEKMYDKDKAPKLDRDEEGKVTVKEGKKPSKQEEGSDEAQAGTEGVEMEDRHAHERREVHHKHMHEHMAMHHKHEIEHSHHEGHKETMHERHEHEKKQMHTRHEHEHKALHDKHEKESMAEDTHGEKHNEGRKKEEKAKVEKAGEK